MTRSRTTWITLLTALFAPKAALCCSVCYGDPESGIAKGVVAGVYVMIGLISFVLTAIAATGLYFFHRSKKLTPTPHTTP